MHTAKIKLQAVKGNHSPVLGKIRMTEAIKVLTHNKFLSGTVFILSLQTCNMETTYAGIKEQLHACLKEREQVADILQNEVNQILAAALLRMQCSKTSDNQAGDAFLQSETYLKAAIDKVRALHYSLATQHFVVLC